MAKDQRDKQHARCTKRDPAPRPLADPCPNSQDREQNEHFFCEWIHIRIIDTHLTPHSSMWIIPIVTCSHVRYHYPKCTFVRTLLPINKVTVTIKYLSKS